MELKTVTRDGETLAKVQDNKPIYVDNKGVEVAFDAPGTIATISARNAEAKGHRERAETYQGLLTQYNGIDDPKAALEALETVKNLEGQKLIAAGESERLRDETKKAIEEKYAPIVKERDKLNNDLRKEIVGGQFARSQFIKNKTIAPPDMLEAVYGKNFPVEDGKITPVDNAGNRIVSKSNPGEMATFEEAIEIMVRNHEYADTLLKGNNSSGSGAHGNNGSLAKNTVLRAEFDTMSQAQRAATIKEGKKIVD